MVKEKTERNRQIYLDRVEKKMSWRELTVKYGLSPSRLKVIVDREKLRKPEARFP